MSDSPSLGESVPPNTSHAVSVSLPTWKANVGYEEGEKWVTDSMTTGYPRFFVHKIIQELATEVVKRHGNPVEEQAILFPSLRGATRCAQFMILRLPAEDSTKVRQLNLHVAPASKDSGRSSNIPSRLCCVLYPKAHAGIAKQVWQHSGDGISSRRGEFCLKALLEGYLVEDAVGQPAAQATQKVHHKGPRRYQKDDITINKPKGTSPSKTREPMSPPGEEPQHDGREFDQFVEERFGRNLNPSLASNAKLAVRRRIAGSLTADGELSEALETAPTDGRLADLTEDHVYLFPSGMSAIFNTHQALLAARGQLKSICFGFPYIDTLKILEKWGPGALFYGHGESPDLDDLEKRLESGERFLALFTEFPGNPLLKSPDLERIRNLANKYDFAVVVDETVSNFINVNVLPYADVVVSSLTKIFSGDSNVMGGSAVFNPHGRYYKELKNVLDKEYEDNYWAEDAVFLERNSRDFVSRIERINASTEALTARLKDSPLIKDLYYPKYSPTKPYYDNCRNPNGGYGSLFSVTFNTTEEATAFFDTLHVMKGPSLGTNFTLSSPYTILAHYGELEWAKSFGVESNLVRVSVGLEESHALEAKFDRALDAVKAVHAL